MSEATFTFRVDEALKAEFSAAAKARDRSGAQIIRDFMREFVQQEAAAHDVWFRRQVGIGLDSANAGHLIAAAEVEARFAAKRAATRQRLEATEFVCCTRRANGHPLKGKATVSEYSTVTLTPV